MSGEQTRWLKAIFDLRVVLAAIAVVYAAGYMLYPMTPGNNLGHPLGWWEWFDQGQYLHSADAFAHFDFSPEKHCYPPLYPLLGAVFVRWWASHPFLLINLVCFLWFALVFVLLADRFIPRWSAVVLLVMSVLGNITIFQNFLIPWTSTLSAALLSTGIFGLLRLNDSAQGHGTTVSRHTALESFCISLALGLIASVRPIDGIVGGLLWFGYVWRGWRLSQNKNAARAIRFKPFFAAAVGGMSIGPAVFLGFNYLVFGSALGGYVQVQLSNGYYPADVAEKFVSLFLDGYTLYLEPKSNLIDHYRWLVLSIFGIGFILVRGDWVLRVIASAICLQVALYLPYGDLLPNGLWRFNNIHYFKWAFPYLGLFAWMLILFLAREWAAARKKTMALIGFMTGAAAVLLALKLDINRIPAVSSIVSPSGSAGVRFISLQTNALETDFIDMTGLQGSFTDVYFGDHKLWADDHELQRIRDFRVLPAPWGVRVLFLRPLRAGSILFQPDSHLSCPGSVLQMDTGTYYFTFDVPRPFRRQKITYPAERLQVGNVVDFSIRGNSDRYVGEGWSEPGPWGRWITGKRAYVRMQIASPRTKPVLLHLRLAALVNPNHPEQKVDITVNNRLVNHLSIRLDREGDGPDEVTLELPDGLIGDDDELNISLSTPDAVSPRSMGINADDRIIGAGVVSLQLGSYR